MTINNDIEKARRETIRKLAIRKYGADPNLYGGQRNGFVEGYLSRDAEVQSLQIEIEWRNTLIEMLQKQS